MIDAIQSVQNQQTSYDLTHLIVWDGIDGNILRSIPEDHNPSSKIQIVTMSLPWNIGRHGFYGHRVYAAISHLVNHDAVFFLDEDNTYASNHVETCLTRLNDADYDFVFSYRNIVDGQNQFICKDRFEALGAEPINLVDTSSYCFNRSFLIASGHIWHHGWGADRRYFQAVKNHSQYACTENYTLNYRLDGNPNSPTKEFFENGNIRAGYTKEGELLSV